MQTNQNNKKINEDEMKWNKYNQNKERNNIYDHTSMSL